MKRINEKMISIEVITQLLFHNNETTGTRVKYIIKIISSYILPDEFAQLSDSTTPVESPPIIRYTQAHAINALTVDIALSFVINSFKNILGQRNLYIINSFHVWLTTRTDGGVLLNCC